MSDFVERVARAIYEAPRPGTSSGDINPLRFGSGEPWDTTLDWYRAVAICQAREAIAAMREPTEKMIEAGTVGWGALDGTGMRPMFAPQRPWRAMIDEALK